MVAWHRRRPPRRSPRRLYVVRAWPFLRVRRELSPCVALIAAWTAPRDTRGGAA